VKSHQIAKQLRATAEFLEARQDLELLSNPAINLFFWNEKESFIEAVKSLLPGKKEYKGNEVIFTPEGTVLRLWLNRSAVCRKVQEEKWECEPLLSPEEGSEMEAPVKANEPESDIPY